MNVIGIQMNDVSPEQAYNLYKDELARCYKLLESQNKIILNLSKKIRQLESEKKERK